MIILRKLRNLLKCEVHCNTFTYAYIIALSFLNMEVSEGVYDFRLENDSTMIISGPSKSGKTTFVIEMIKNKDKLFPHPINNIWWFYGIKSSIHDEIKQLRVMLKEGLPTHEDINAVRKHDLVILDDLQQESKTNDDITSLFLKASHHQGFFAVQITQYLYGNNEQRMRNANAHYFVAFNNPRNQQQIGQFLSKMFPKGNIHIIHQIFSDIIKRDGKFGYVFVDFTSKCEPNLRLRTNLFKKPMIVFKLNQNMNRGKMDYSEMIVIPKSEYDQMREQRGGGVMEDLASKTKEDAHIKQFMEPDKSYVEGLARHIVNMKPTVDNVNRYNMLLAAFDKIRRNFFKIPGPPEEKKVQTTAQAQSTQTHHHKKIRDKDDIPYHLIRELFKTPKPYDRPPQLKTPFYTPKTPLSKFQKSPMGEVSKRIRRLRKIPDFIY